MGPYPLASGSCVILTLGITKSVRVATRGRSTQAKAKLWPRCVELGEFWAPRQERGYQ